MAKIINRFTGDIIIQNENLTLYQLMEKAVEEGADLEGAYLKGADLEGADLEGAYLKGADLEGAKNIENSEWTNKARQQILYIFSYQPISEIEGLKNKIIEGKINGEIYEGDCCCLIGSLGNDKAASCIPYYNKGLHNIGEQLFYHIKKGDTPETNIFSKIALELCDEFLANKIIKREIKDGN